MISGGAALPSFGPAMRMHFADYDTLPFVIFVK